jgi:hypothetical protein
MDYLKLLKNITTITGVDITKKSRRREIVEIKAIYCNILRNENYIYKEIGNSINMNHASIIHLIKLYDIIKNQQSTKRIENKIKLLNEGFNFENLEYQNEIDELKIQNEDLKNENENLKNKIKLENNEFFENLFKLANSNQFIYDKLVNFYNINSKLKF